MSSPNLILRMHTKATGSPPSSLLRYLTRNGRHDTIQMFNLPTDCPELAARVMQATIDQAAELKAVAGKSARGRRLKKPLVHISGSWPEGIEVSNEHMIETMNEVAKAVGLEDPTVRRRDPPGHQERPRPSARQPGEPRGRDGRQRQPHKAQAEGRPGRVRKDVGTQPQAPRTSVTAGGREHHSLAGIRRTDGDR